MKINTDINIIGGMTDFNLIISQLLEKNIYSVSEAAFEYSLSQCKTQKSYSRFSKAINNSLIHFTNEDLKQLYINILTTERISNLSLYLLFLNTAINNDLFNYLNQKAFFPAYYSGRTALRSDEVTACIKELRETEEILKSWSESSIKTTASKYLTVLKKFELMEGKSVKKILNKNLDDKAFILFIYWLLAVEENANLLQSKWLKYSFFEKEVFIQFISQKKFINYFNIQFTGDNLKIQLLIPYGDIYDKLS